MPTTASTKAYTGADVPQGPAEVWIKAAVPAAGAAVVLHSDGSLDATTNPGNIFLGKLEAGASWLYDPKFFEGRSDESPTSFRDLISGEEFTIKGKWMEGQSATKLAAMMVGASSTALVGPPASTLITVGGQTIPPPFSVVLVWQQPEAPTKYISVQIYKALNQASTGFDISKQKLGSSDFNFKALSVDSRAVGDRLAGINIQT